MRFRVLLVACIFLPASVWAATIAWTESCRTSKPTTALSPGEYACLDPTANDDVSTILGVGICENIDVFHFDDKNGDATVSTTTWEIEGCPFGESQSQTAAGRNAACEILSGTAALSGDDVESNLAGIFIRVKGDGAGANPEDSRIMVKCAERAN